MMKECIAKNQRVGINFKLAILEMNAIEMIPVLTSTYLAARKDNDILTLLMLLMKENKYEPFINSASFLKLYGNESNYQASLNLNRANGDLIIKRASEFFNEKRN